MRLTKINLTEVTVCTRGGVLWFFGGAQLYADNRSWAPTDTDLGCESERAAHSTKSRTDLCGTW